MMMIGLRRYQSTVGVARYLAVAVCIGVVFLLAPYLRDLLLSVISTPETPQAEYQSVLYAELAKENADLRARLFARTPDQYSSARVIAAPPKTHYDSLLIGAGTDAGVLVGDEVVFDEFVIGTVTNASAQSATVQLFTSPDTERDAYFGDPRTVTTLSGEGAGAFSARIPVSVTVAVGDAVKDVITGKVLGIVTGTRTEATDTDMTVYIAALSVSHIDIVSLIHQILIR